MKKWQNIIKILMIITLLSKSLLSFAQVPTDSLPGDPGAISVYTVQNMSFGAFSPGATGGTVAITKMGARIATGSIVPLNLGTSYFQAIFDFEGPENSIISIMNGPNATLTGSNGGTMSLRLDDSNPTSPFNMIAQPPNRTSVSIGGTLSVGNSATTPAGSYSGTFYITFNVE
jgi:hypothetical protein